MYEASAAYRAESFKRSIKTGLNLGFALQDSTRLKSSTSGRVPKVARERAIKRLLPWTCRLYVSQFFYSVGDRTYEYSSGLTREPSTIG